MNPKNRFGIPRLWQSIVVIALVTAVTLLVTVPAFAVHDKEFQLEGNIVDDGPGVDWANFFNSSGSPISPLPTNFVASSFSRDFVPGAFGPDRTTFTTGSKDILNISPGWQCARSNNVNDKIDLLNVYATAYVDPVSGHTIIYFALERFSNDGDANVAFWFLQDPSVGCIAPASGPSTTSFTGNHIDGDLLIVSSFTKGGVVSTVTGYEWVGGANGFLNTTPVFNQQDCKNTQPGDIACATVNGPTNGNITPPWPTEDKDGDNILNISEFYEGGVDLTAANLGGRCFNKFIADTRSSQSLTATLFDFAGGDLPLCDMKVTKTGDTLSKVGDDVNYTITIKNTGGITLYKQSIIDSLLGNLTANVGCGASLAPGASCTINVSRTVLVGDPDPLPNTVTAIYDAKPDLTGDEVTRTASHSVNLFQPSITFDKSVDSHLSKVGDSVKYTLTLKNTSSSDTPDLVCSISDPTLLISKSVTLASGGSDVTTKSYTFQLGDPDPYNNTASVSCSPTGFPNVLTKSDSESVNLFQPAVAVDKTGDTLSKVGDEVNYKFTLSNNSSADTPALTCTAEDSLLGSVFSGTLPLGNTVVNKSRTVQQSDPDPLKNTVTLTCSVAGFPNVLSASDDHSVNLFQPSITFDKSVDSHLSKVGDSVKYTLTLNNTSSSDTPDLKCTISDPTLLVSKSVTLASGGSDVTTKSYTFQLGDPDPYNNTASVTCSPTGFPNVLTKSDSESVNLFQPAIAADKTGDALSKVGDDVNYTITLSNNSSVDTPAMTCTAKDSLLGSSIFSGVLPLGDTIINTSRTVQAGDPDPLLNTVTLTCSPDGFANVLTASKGHSTNLFQPAVEVIKSGPATAARGQTVTYSFTINNLSSLDSPDLILASVTDTVLGDLTATANANSCGTLASGGSCNFTFNYTTLSTDPNPLVNVVTVLYHPQGFPNNITDDDNHSLSFPTQGCTPGWWKNQGFGAFDSASDPLAIAVTNAVANYWYGGVVPAGFDGTHDALFRVAFNLTPAQMSAVGLDPNLTLLGAIQLNGGNYFALARQGTSALLNSVSVDYPYDANQVLQMMHDGIANQNLDNLINIFDNANNLDHSSCPTG